MTVTTDRPAVDLARGHAALGHHRRRDPRRRPAPAPRRRRPWPTSAHVLLERQVVFFPGQHLDPDEPPRASPRRSASRRPRTR